MDFSSLLAVIRRRRVVFLTLLVAILGAFIVRGLQPPPEVRKAAVTRVIIRPDPRTAVPWAPAVLPPYQSFRTKLHSMTSQPVIDRATELARGDRPFASELFRDEAMATRIARGIETVRARFDSEDATRAALRGHVSVRQIERQQIVEVSASTDDGELSIFFTWAIAEATCQHHAERIRRGATRLTMTLDAEIDAVRGALEEEYSRQLAEGGFDPRFAREMDSRILRRGALITTRQFALERKLRRNEKIAEWHQQGEVPRHLLVSPMRGELRGYGEALLAARIGLVELASTRTFHHPDVVEAVARIGELERRVREEERVTDRELADARARYAGELARERTELLVELDVLADLQQELVAQLTELSHQRVGALLDGGGAESLEGELAQLLHLRRRTDGFQQTQADPVIVLSPAMRANPTRPGPAPGIPWLLLVPFSLAVALAAVVLLDQCRSAIVDQRDVGHILGLPVLGVIPKRRREASLLAQPDSELAESFESLAATLAESPVLCEQRAWMVCSAARGEGKTTVAVHLATALARRGLRVALVDGDLRHPQVHELLGVSADGGFPSSFESSPGHAPRQLRLQRTATDPLHVLAGGHPSFDAVPNLDHGHLERLVVALKSRYDFVIFDTPPLGEVGDALAIAAAVDDSLFVVRAGVTDRNTVAQARRMLELAGAPVRGVVLNQVIEAPSSAFAASRESLLPSLAPA